MYRGTHHMLSSSIQHDYWSSSLGTAAEGQVCCQSSSTFLIDLRTFLFLFSSSLVATILTAISHGCNLTCIASTGAWMSMISPSSEL